MLPDMVVCPMSGVLSGFGGGVDWVAWEETERGEEELDMRKKKKKKKKELKGHNKSSWRRKK